MSRMTRDVALMTAGTMTSRLFGLARGILLASVIGAAGLTADVFQVANTLPNTLYILVGGGILNGILVPQIVKAKLHDDGGAEFVNRIVTLTTAFLLGSTVLVTLAAPWLVHLFSDFRADALELSTTFAYICLPQMFFYGMYTLLGQILNARGLFWPYLWAPVVANLVAIVGLIWFRLAGYPLGAPISQWTPAMVAILGGTATLSIAIHAVALIIPLRPLGFRFRPGWGLRGVGLGTSSRVAMWTFAAVAVSQLGFMVTSQALTRAADVGKTTGESLASRSAFDNAFLIVMLPHSLVTVSLVTALFNRISTAVAHDDAAAVRADYRRGLRTIAPILIPVVALLAAFAPVVTSSLFIGNPTSQTNAVAQLVSWMVLGVLPYGWLYLNDRTFFAHDDGRTPFITQVVVTSIAALFAFAAWQGDPQLTGLLIGVGQSTAYLVGAAVGTILVHRRLGSLGMAGVLGTYARIALPAAGYAAVLAWLVARLLPDLGHTRGVTALITGGLVLAIVGVLHLTATWVTAHLLGVTEIGQAKQALLSRLPRRSRAGA